MDALEKLSLRVTDPAKLLDALNAHILRLEGHIAGLDQRAENSHRKLKCAHMMNQVCIHDVWQGV